MDNTKLVNDIINNSNYNDISQELSDFVKIYIQKLISDITLYVDSNISIEKIELTDFYNTNNELSQNITGIPSAYSAIDGDETALVNFAEAYCKLGVDKFDTLCKEAIVDFLNLHNGLFIVHLSQLNLCELSLTAPVQEGTLDLSSSVKYEITIIHVKFSFGTVKFLLLET